MNKDPRIVLPYQSEVSGAAAAALGSVAEPEIDLVLFLDSCYPIINLSVKQQATKKKMAD